MPETNGKYTRTRSAKVALYLRLSAQLKAELEAEASLDNVPMTYLVQEAVRELIARRRARRQQIDRPVISLE